MLDKCARQAIGCLLLSIAFGVLASAAAFAQQSTLGTVVQRGTLQCGANQVPWQSHLSPDGAHWKGFTVDFCRAIAAAVLGDADRVEIFRVDGQSRFEALKNGDVDMLTEGTTWTLGRELTLNTDFPAIYLYDGQGFLVPKALGVKSLSELNKARVCVQLATTTYDNLVAYIAAKKLSLEVIGLESTDGAWAAFLKGRCEVYTDDRTNIASKQVSLTSDPDDFVLLPEVISKEPLCPVVRKEDRQWFSIVRAVVFTMIAAEEYGITSQNINSVQAKDPQILMMTGQKDDRGDILGLKPGWMKRVLEQVGNYQEVYDRNLGVGSDLKLDRGVNRLWTQGGLLYVPPL